MRIAIKNKWEALINLNVAAERLELEGGICIAIYKKHMYIAVNVNCFSEKSIWKFVRPADGHVLCNQSGYTLSELVNIITNVLNKCEFYYFQTTQDFGEFLMNHKDILLTKNHKKGDLYEKN